MSFASLEFGKIGILHIFYIPNYMPPALMGMVSRGDCFIICRCKRWVVLAELSDIKRREES